MFRLGQQLRKLYDRLLGYIYYPEILSARSTSSDRAIMSMQLVLAGLFPPSSEQIWNDEINWQPIPVHYVPLLDDVLMWPRLCPK